MSNTIIDNDHKYLLSLINTIEAAFNCNADKTVLARYGEQLMAYTQKHFEMEQVLQKEIGFTEREAHEREHAGLIKRLNSVIEELDSIEDENSYVTALPKLNRMLRDWLLDHILSEDMKMKDYFKARSPESFTEK